ncbi:hypothetical protein ANN_10449 [Periplaneta americana]|uniref:Uncharacterized protein n=1 Tax=Periplaneta americana TaxID=6978 RepID=A0ABQ8TQ45_PERAM|nr:hypothetical protein ANN_10449 [Periplaneta americana]
MFHGSLGPLTCRRDFFLCEYLKARVYEDKPRILYELKDTVRQHITQINRDPLERIEGRAGHERAQSSRPELLSLRKALQFQARAERLRSGGLTLQLPSLH